MYWYLVLLLFVNAARGIVSCHQSKSGYPLVEKLDKVNVNDLNGSSLYVVHWNCTSNNYVWVTHGKAAQVKMPGTYFVDKDNILRTVSYVSYSDLQSFNSQSIQINLKGDFVECETDQRICVVDVERVSVSERTLQVPSHAYPFESFISIDRMTLRNATFLLLLLIVGWIFVIEELVLTVFKIPSTLNIVYLLNKYIS